MRTLIVRSIVTLALGTLITAASAQTELLRNADIVRLSQAGLGKELIINKIKTSPCEFDASVDALVELKKAGVDDVIVGVMMEKARDNKPAAAVQSSTAANTTSNPSVTAKQALLSAKTIALKKSSLNPTRQALEKELLKRPEWKNYDLTITEYKDTADLYIDIGFVHGSLITHRYVYRIYDRRTGLVIAAGETTSWGSLAENLARNIVRSLEKVRNG
jgi:hypothetical protein